VQIFARQRQQDMQRRRSQRPGLSDLLFHSLPQPRNTRIPIYRVPTTVSSVRFLKVVPGFGPAAAQQRNPRFPWLSP
jgi:hypothetical protein